MSVAILPLWVDPEAIKLQRERGWPDFHPETFCHRCGGKNVRSWSVESDRFNAAVAALGLNSVSIICPGCFVLGHEKATGMHCSWRLVPDPMTPFRHNEDDHDF